MITYSIYLTIEHETPTTLIPIFCLITAANLTFVSFEDISHFLFTTTSKSIFQDLFNSVNPRIT